MPGFLSWFLNTLMSATLIGSPAAVQTSQTEVDSTRSNFDESTVSVSQDDRDDIRCFAHIDDMNSMNEMVDFLNEKWNLWLLNEVSYACPLLDLTLGHEKANEICYTGKDNDDHIYYQYKIEEDSMATVKKILDPVLFKPAINKLMMLLNNQRNYVICQDYFNILIDEIVKNAKDNGVDISMLTKKKNGVVSDLLHDVYSIRKDVLYVATSDFNDMCGWIRRYKDELFDDQRFCEANPKEDNCEKFLEKLTHCQNSPDETYPAIARFFLIHARWADDFCGYMQTKPEYHEMLAYCKDHTDKKVCSNALALYDELCAAKDEL